MPIKYWFNLIRAIINFCALLILEQSFTKREVNNYFMKKNRLIYLLDSFLLNFTLH